MRNRFVRFGALLVVAWCAMATTHESGHVLGGWLCGGTLREAHLYPWELPYSNFDPDPHPLVTLWCGPALGVLAPLLVATVVRRPWMWFVSHFCTLANGCYLAVAWLTGDRFLDTPKLLEHGASPVMIAAYCVLTIGLGYVAFRAQCIQVLSPQTALSA